MGFAVRIAVLLVASSLFVLSSARAEALAQDGGASSLVLPELDPAAVARFVRARTGAVRACYERILVLNPAAAGRLTAAWTINIDGRVKDFHWQRDDIGDPLLLACVREKIERWEFSPAPSKTVDVSFPFIFQSEQPKGGGAAPSALGATPPTAEHPSPDDAARTWLSAVRRGDKAAIKSNSGFPLTVEGFQTDSGPAREGCGGAPRSDGIVGVREFHAKQGLRTVIGRAEDADKGLTCLLADGFLREYIPKPTPTGGWLPVDDRSEDASGSATIVSLAKLTKHLRRYREQARKLARDHVFVQVVMTDRNGVTNSVLLAMHADDAQRFVVDAAYFDELFED
jgi:hypothetical protein